jgi:hypothetical protein
MVSTPMRLDINSRKAGGGNRKRGATPKITSSGLTTSCEKWASVQIVEAGALPVELSPPSNHHAALDLSATP